MKVVLCSTNLRSSWFLERSSIRFLKRFSYCTLCGAPTPYSLWLFQFHWFCSMHKRFLAFSLANMLYFIYHCICLYNFNVWIRLIILSIISNIISVVQKTSVFSRSLFDNGLLYRIILNLKFHKLTFRYHVLCHFWQNNTICDKGAALWIVFVSLPNQWVRRKDQYFTETRSRNPQYILPNLVSR